MTTFQFILKVDDQLFDKSLDAIYFNNQEVNDESVFTMLKKGEVFFCHIDMLKGKSFQFEFDIKSIHNIGSIQELYFYIEFNDEICNITINKINILNIKIENL